jgi:hypothetical protein
VWRHVRALVIFASVASTAVAQQPATVGPDVDYPDSGRTPSRSSAPSSTPDADDTHGWTLGFDSAVFGTFNRQGGLRGDREFVSQNWAMGMGTRRLGRGALTVIGMGSAEPATTRQPGYSEIFQMGEAYRGLQITDHQHPHDLIMQLSASWRIPLGDRGGLTVAGGPRGEAALGPVAFMHRPSSAENPTAPLSHHVLDSTHISTGVLLIGLDSGPFAVEGSWFRGREPDEHRYNLEVGAPDSWSTRLWFRPGSEWTIQGSYGFLHEPEQLEAGNQRRTNGSVSWFRQRESRFTAVTAAVGRNARTFSTVRAFLLEGTHSIGRTSVYGRFEDLTVETEILLLPQIVHRPHQGELVDPIRTLTGGAVRDVASLHGFSFGVGGDVSVYRVPALLQFTHGERPISFHVFVRVRPPSRGEHMWNMTMGQPMVEHNGMGGHGGMDHDHR